jgi:hypothetical protein
MKVKGMNDEVDGINQPFNRCPASVSRDHQGAMPLQKEHRIDLIV